MMKKSQILAALALAMALGVVAPVAGASALTLEERNALDQITVHGKATCKEALTAVKYVKEHTDYSKILAFRTAVEGVIRVTTDKTFVDPGTEWSVMWIDGNEALAMVDKILGNQGTGVPGTGSDVKKVIDASANNTNSSHIAAWHQSMTDAFADFTANGGVYTYDNTVAVINSISNLNGYTEYEGIYKAAKANNPTQFQQAVRAYNAKYTGANLNSNADTLKDLHDAVDAYENGRAYTIGAIGGTHDFKAVFQAFVPLFVDMNQAKGELDAYKAARKTLTDAYNNLAGADLILNTHDNRRENAAYKAYLDDQENGWTYLANLVSIVYDMDWAEPDMNLKFANGLTANVYHAALWNDVADAIDDVVCTTRTDEGDVYYQQLAPLAVAYKAAAELDQALTTVIATMVNYTPQTPVVVPDVDPSIDAPLSGVLGSAEGSATTISIVAGLATALTALGAGVVAYRNARREK